MNEDIIPEIPIVACTAYGGATEIENCLASGMDDYINKPLNLENLKNLLIKWKIVISEEWIKFIFREILILYNIYQGKYNLPFLVISSNFPVSIVFALFLFYP